MKERKREKARRGKTLGNTKTRNEENIGRRPPGPEVADDREKDGKIPTEGREQGAAREREGRWKERKRKRNVEREQERV